MKTIRFLDLECVEWELGDLKIIVTESVGPRILSLRLGDHPNMLAELPGLTLDCPGAGPYHFYGGHRLWQAPENPSRTYLPDDEPVEVLERDNGLLIREASQRKNQLRREIHIFPGPKAGSLQLNHILVNEGRKAITCSAWAITQLRVGGFAYLPQRTAPLKNNPTLPNRSLALWPYTDLASPYIQWGGSYCRVEAKMRAADPPLKLGFPNPSAWLAYCLGGLVFMKWAPFDPDKEYFDLGSSSECYCNAQFLELETLGPISRVPPGQSIAHTETWHLFEYKQLENPMPEITENIDMDEMLV